MMNRIKEWLSSFKKKPKPWYSVISVTREKFHRYNIGDTFMDKGVIVNGFVDSTTKEYEYLLVVAEPRE
jgi:hypothetical protein